MLGGFSTLMVCRDFEVAGLALEMGKKGDGTTSW